MSEPHALTCKTVNIWGGDFRRWIEAFDITDSYIVRQDENDIGRIYRSMNDDGGRREDEKGKEYRLEIHDLFYLDSADRVCTRSCLRRDALGSV